MKLTKPLLPANDYRLLTPNSRLKTPNSCFKQKEPTVPTKTFTD
jgi:hypothetical protein